MGKCADYGVRHTKKAHGGDVMYIIQVCMCVRVCEFHVAERCQMDITNFHVGEI